MNDPLLFLGYVLFGLYALALLWLLLSAAVQLHLLWHYKRGRREPPALPPLSPLPQVTVQLPIYNEKYVVGRLLDAVACLDYPRERLEVQVLDDSTDETREIIDKQVADLQARGLSIRVLRRQARRGYKAGALQEGLEQATGELVAIFDADFTPPAQFLRAMAGYFSDGRVGLVQARWGHLNGEQNLLTRIQTFLLDTHFSVEQAGRQQAGYFINFCGTAGVWRRRCIEDAGGWDGRVLSEDLDLSFRAQLRGWKMLYVPEAVVPAELPSMVEAFKVQQFRWTKGMAQSSRKHLVELLSAPLPLATKVHGVFHLLGSFVFVCLFVSAVLTVPMLVLRNLYTELVELTRYTVIAGLNLVVLTLIYYHGTRSGPMRWQAAGFWLHYPLFLVVYMGLSVQNAVAVLQGFWGRQAEFVRTPKLSTQPAEAGGYLSGRFTWIHAAELACFAYFLAGIGLCVHYGDYFLLLFFILILSGLGFLLYHSWVEFRPLRAAVFRQAPARPAAGPP